MAQRSLLGPLVHLVAFVSTASAWSACSVNSDLEWRAGPTVPCVGTQSLQAKTATPTACVGDIVTMDASLTQSCGSNAIVSTAAVFATTDPKVVACEKNICRGAGVGTAKVIALYQGMEAAPVAITIRACDAGTSDASTPTDDAASDAAASDAATDDTATGDGAASDAVTGDAASTEVGADGAGATDAAGAG